MILDSFLRTDTARALTAAGTFQSTDSIDLGSNQNRDIADGEPLMGMFSIPTAFLGGTSIEFQVITSANANLSSGTVIGTSGPIPLAQLTQGRRIPVYLNPRPSGIVNSRYIGHQYVVTGVFTAGTVTADITSGQQGGQTFYASGYTA